MISKALRVRLPLLLAAAVGAWLWQSDLWPQSRELVFSLPPAREVTVQLSTEGGELVWQTERSFAEPTAARIRQELQLRKGRYVCRLFAKDTQGAAHQQSRTVDLGAERTLEIDLASAL